MNAVIVNRNGRLEETVACMLRRLLMLNFHFADGGAGSQAERAARRMRKPDFL